MNANVSVKQLAGPQLIEAIRGYTRRNRYSRRTPLDWKLRKALSSRKLNPFQDVLSRLRALQIGLQLDDFGTGYSSLSCLRTLRFDSLKIDLLLRAAPGLEDPRNAAAIVETILNLARSLHMTAIAEGIENEDQRTLLLDLGCDAGQGFLFFETRLRGSRRTTPGIPSRCRLALLWCGLASVHLRVSW